MARTIHALSLGLGLLPGMHRNRRHGAANDEDSILPLPTLEGICATVPVARNSRYHSRLISRDGALEPTRKYPGLAVGGLDYMGRLFCFSTLFFVVQRTYRAFRRRKSP